MEGGIWFRRRQKRFQLCFVRNLPVEEPGVSFAKNENPATYSLATGVQAPYVRSHSVDCTAACVCWPVPRSDYFPGDPWSQKGTNSLFGCCEVPTE